MFDDFLENLPHLIEQAFLIDVADGETIELTLVEVQGPELKPEEPSLKERKRPLSLLFRGPRTPILTQKIYALKHAMTGRQELFLVPVAPDEENQYYEAVIN